MHERANFRLTPFLVIFTASGFSGLIYESIWTQYLKLFLGHAAYAQTLVLAIFMGGMALGSWLSSRYSAAWKNLFIGYAIIEGGIGIFALIFHQAFDQAVRLSYTAVIPSLQSATGVVLFKWTLSTLMILPQSVLLGMTFPLMSAGIIRCSPNDPGRTLSLLYFTNSIGAALGVLASGFLLIRLFGLPGTIRTAGIINIALALSVYMLVKKRQPVASGLTTASDRSRQHLSGTWYRFFLLVSLATGLSSFVYEIGWIRMLSLVLGSSTQAFELMLSSFITGLAFGSLWLRRRADRLEAPERALSYLQIAMGFFAIATLPVYGYSFEVMQWLMHALKRTGIGYVLFNLSSNAIALSVMLPATFCAGMTLPLLTLILLRRGYGERSIGTVYAANTVGAIIGVFFAVHVGLPLLGLKGLMIVGAGLDILVGIALLWRAAPNVSTAAASAVTAACVLAVAGTSFVISLDPYEMASGVYRRGKLLTKKDARIVYHRDGKTATVSVTLDKNGVMSVRTNGKVDAGINMRPGTSTDPFADESTMVLLAMLPLAMHPQSSEAAVIGFGSGLTTDTILRSPNIHHVDTVEIERFMVEASKHFRPRVDSAYADPRSEVHIDDAKTFFVRHKKQYDIIISEPSNPWVSGVASLFSKEFYRQMNDHLTRDGLFVQWVQLYEIDLKLVVSVLKALSSNFADFHVYAATDGDMIIVARKTGTIPDLDGSMFGIPWIADSLQKVHISSMQDLAARKLGSKNVLGEMLERYPVLANSDYYPVIDQNAARTRFLQSNAQELIDYGRLPLPALEILTASAPGWRRTDIAPSDSYYPSAFGFAAMAMRDFITDGRFADRYTDVPDELKRAAIRLRQLYYACPSASDEGERFFSLFQPMSLFASQLRPEELETIWGRLERGPCTARLSPSERNWVRLFKTVGRRDAAGMAAESRSILSSELAMPPVAERYAIAAGMLGSLAQGNREDAGRLWSLYREDLSGDDGPDLLFRVLATKSAGLF